MFLVSPCNLSNSLKPGVMLRKKTWLEQHRQAILKLHLSDQQFHSSLKCAYITGFRVFYFIQRIWNNVIQHVSHGILINFFSIWDPIGDPSKIKYHCYQRVTTMSIYIKFLQFLIHTICILWKYSTLKHTMIMIMMIMIITTIMIMIMIMMIITTTMMMIIITIIMMITMIMMMMIMIMMIILMKWLAGRTLYISHAW